MPTRWVTLRHETTGGTQRFSASVVDFWRTKGWVLVEDPSEQSQVNTGVTPVKARRNSREDQSNG